MNRDSRSLQDFKGVMDKSAASTVAEKLTVMNQMAANELEKMTDSETTGFVELYGRYMSERSKKAEIKWDLIEQPSENMLQKYDTLPKPATDEELASLLSKLAVLKLNGGLGTSMGCKGPKSVIEVRDDTTFLDLIVQQIGQLNKNHPTANVPLLLMNSFNTDSETAKIIRKYQDTSVTLTTFQQSRYPRIVKESLEPMPLTHDHYAHEDWYPPGHGDFFQSIYNSGLVDTLLAQGKEYIFVSNVDNLGATVDLNILKNVVDREVEYCMELTDKTRADIKGGTIISYDGKVSLLEVAQVPAKYVEEFKSISKFKVFNTNNIWVSLRAIKRVMQSGEMKLDIIVNNKEVKGTKVIQLESAIGAAIGYFNNACGVNVPRSRFLPVKSTSDLMLIQSNMYNLKSGSLVMNPARQFTTTPVIKLGKEFKKVAQYLERLGSIPDILELDHLTVSGDVYFGANTTLKGTVIVVANPGNTIMIPEGSVLENKVVLGSLHVIPH
uniref:UTP--glucose-1-phosphate uridylyltransferase n=1 Tax=Gracilaria gracilis TaxID=2777 RepID=Q9ZSL9_GRAGA|nr:UDPglucose pyrophosphorylase [Gracilaria gracilis]